MTTIRDASTDIMEAARLIAEDIAGLDLGTFLSDGKTQRSVVKSLLDIGNATATLQAHAPSIEVDNPELWRSLRTVRRLPGRDVERLTYNYDAAGVWSMATTLVPLLTQQLLREPKARRTTAEPSTRSRPRPR